MIPQLIETNPSAPVAVADAAANSAATADGNPAAANSAAAAAGNPAAAAAAATGVVALNNPNPGRSIHWFSRSILNSIQGPWTPPLRRSFTSAQRARNQIEKDYYGAYNKLLNSLFPPDSDFDVIPQFATSESNYSSVDFVVTLFVAVRSTVIFLLEIKPPRDLRHGSKRRAADEQISCRFRDTQEEVHVPVVHAVSAFGTKLAFFEYHKESRRIKPARLPEEGPDVISDTVPETWWDSDITEQAGAAKFQAVIDKVMRLSVAFQNAQ